ncbi:Protein phosphatase PTC7 like protein [Verticillium longisporum]|uniref:Protein phosphatase n=2 Tax=Verticillium longisporum TaxID=100787 RepID=A0A8I2ZSI0_VERLO|nr:Protein phosphatase PTC7 like protein [Verticillium longisporum]KAG7137947.1 Protein phosphatase PTC7 like protein [Verticillium longisporum]
MAASLTAARQPLTLCTARQPISIAIGLVSKPLPRNSRPTSSHVGRPIPARSMSSTPRGGPFSFHVAASFIGKDRRYDPSTHVFHFNPYNRIQQTKHNKRSRPDSGHDAFFVSRVGDTGSVALGVADGVGGWVDSGVDPADFSHGLCEYVASAAYEYNPSVSSPADPSTPPSARSLLQAGYQSVCEDRSIRAGGSTACIAVADPSGSIDVANLGDSGFVQLRLGAVHAASEPQTHAFNTPFQLSVVPPSVAARMAAFGGAQLSDFPRDADVSRHGLRHGDVLIFASDGVWDNLFNQDILRVASRVMAGAGAWVTAAEGEAENGGTRVIDDLASLTEQQQKTTSKSAVTLQSVLATELVAAAKAASVNRKLDGPFAKEVQKWYPHENWRGGKVDDIVVVVAIVSDDSKAAPPKSKL